MTFIESVFFFIGVALFALVALFVLIPVGVGAVQFWIHYLRLFKKTHAKSKDEQIPPAA